MTETVPVKNAAPTETIAGSLAAGFDKGMHPPVEPVVAKAQAVAASGVAGAASAVADKANEIATKVVEKAKEGAAVVADAAANPGATVDKVEDKAESFWETIKKNGPKILGGILGLGGAWLLGNMFGDGIFSTILMIGLAFPLMAIGSDKLGGWISGLMGNKTPEHQVAQQPAVPAVGQAQQVNGPQQAGPDVTKQQPVVRLTNDDLNILLDATHDRVMLIQDANNQMVAKAVPTTDAPLPGMLDRAKIAAIEAAVPGSTSIGYFANTQGSLSVVGLPARAPSVNQR